MYIPLTFEGTSQRCLYARGGYEGYWVSGSQQYGYHLYTGSSTFTVDRGTISNAEIFVVGGGGGGGSQGGTQVGGGGGGGGVAYQTNVRLFGGTYTITVGEGGAGGIYSSTLDRNGQTGGSSSFNGSNFFLGAGGGGGGDAVGTTPYRGGASGDPTRFQGGASSGGEGGGGGGATGAGINANVPNNTKSQGGPGYLYTPSQWEMYFGCGGAGTQIDPPSPVQGGCAQAGEEQADANPIWAFGCGGGGGAQYDGGTGTYTRAGNGSSGCVIIKYPISTPCNDYFIGTGSCGCTQQAFNIYDSGDLNPVDRTGSYTYVPCGYTSSVVSGSLLAGFSITACGVSGSTGSIQTNSDVGGGIYTFGQAGQARCLAKDRPC
jgi:hypothetical protein